MAAMTFEVKVPCEINCKKIIHKKGIKIKQIDEDNACWKKQECGQDYCNYAGCYVFALKVGKGYRPIYVGKTEKSLFRYESFSKSNIKKYNETLLNGDKGTPVIFFIHDGKKVNNEKGKIISKVEKLLIEAGAIKNPDLKNIHGKNKKMEWTIKGVVNNAVNNKGKGKPTKEAHAFKKMMGFN